MKITNFANASLLTGEQSEIDRPSVPDDSLPYRSPEQTGRMNRSTDHRSDLYSLGVTMYEMLTGRLPFAGEGPVKLIHQHLTAEAVPPSVLDPNIPGALSDIIMKCLSKNADDRYQSAFGLRPGSMARERYSWEDQHRAG